MAEEALEVAQCQVANEFDKAQVAEEKQRVEGERLKMAEAKVFVLENRLNSATIEIKVTEEWAENAEEIARRSDAEIADLKAAVITTEQKTAEAVENFRRSDAYNEKLAETTALAYNGGFQDCKEKVRRLYGLEGIEEL